MEDNDRWLMMEKVKEWIDEMEKCYEDRFRNIERRGRMSG
jgi:hypothetical protein